MEAATIQAGHGALDTFTQCGLGVIRGLLSPAEVDALVAETERLRSAPNARDPGHPRYRRRPGTDGADLIERIDPVADISAVFAALNRDARLLSLAEAALGEPVTVLKEKLVYKWPGEGGRGAHRDGPYLGVSGVPAADILTLLIALDRTTLENGTTEFFPGLRLVPRPAPAEEPRDVAAGALDGEWSLMPELDRGDVALFDGLLPHQSGPNGSAAPRRTYFVTFAPARYGRCRERYYAARLPGAQQAASPAGTAYASPS